MKDPGPKSRASLRTALDALPNLTSGARDRIRAAVEDATALLAMGLSAASQSLNAIRHPQHVELIARLRSWSRACRDLKIEAQDRVFDAVAAE